MNNKYKSMIVKKLIVSISMILTVSICVLTGCESTGKRSTYGYNNGTTSDSSSDAQKVTGVITGVDDTTSMITIQEIESDELLTLNYSAESKITDKFDQDIDGSELEEGQIVETSFDEMSMQIKTMDIPEDVWEYKEVDDYSIDDSKDMLKVAGGKYQYNDQTYIATSDNEPISIDQLNTEDELTVRGIDYKVYSIVRTNGHGYIRLKNYDDFIGGMIEIGDNIILPITANMLITAPAGQFSVFVGKDELTGTKNVTVNEDKETVLNLKEFKAKLGNIGYVKFKIEPEGAALAINGTQVDYSKKIPLRYGTYKVSVTLSGYSTYTGTLDVEQVSNTVSISLVDAPTTAAASTTLPNSTSASSTTETKTMDSDHVIKINAPKGAEVYLDNVYKGVVPCSFTKIIGSQTLTLAESGYITKSYSVDILDDDQDVTLRFSQLIEDSDTATATPSSTD